MQTTLARDRVPAQVDETIVQQAAANIFDAGDDVRFTHQLLQEYFTALTMQERLENGSLDAGKLWPHDRFWQPSGWEDAAILLAGLYDTDCSPILRWLLPANPEMVYRCLQRAGVACDDRMLAESETRWRGAMTDVEDWPQPVLHERWAASLKGTNISRQWAFELTIGKWAS